MFELNFSGLRMNWVRRRERARVCERDRVRFAQEREREREELAE